MKAYRSDDTRRAFTLVELLVVISIIAVLIGVLLPAISGIRTRATTVRTTAQLTALEQGIEQFRGESAFGGTFPPSSGDDPSGRFAIADPLEEGDSDQDPTVKIAGAHLLVHAMVGADLLGTPGFRDLDRDGHWADDTHAGIGPPAGSYAIDATTAEELVTRYGGAGYISEKMKEESITTLGTLEDEGKIAFWDDAPAKTATRKQPLFVDPWDYPILYYKASPASRRMIASEDQPGIYRQDDNAIITGCKNGIDEYAGIDFGAGGTDEVYHHIALADAPEPMDDLDGPKFDNSFARFIWDRAVKARNTPVRKDAYLLISAGPDGIYGSDDDIGNWTRNLD